MTAPAYRYRPSRVTRWAGRVPWPKTAVDEEVVLRAREGERLRLTVAERREAVRLLLREGLSSNQIAERLDVSFRTVQRIRGAIARES